MTEERRRYGPIPIDPLERFLENIELTPDGCWRWTGHLNNKGYATFYLNDIRRNMYAHRWAYQYFIGPIARKLHSDHTCRHTWCVNPNHIEPVTCAVNILRGKLASITHCPRGHEYSQENTKWQHVKGRASHRTCRACHKERNKQWYERMRLEWLKQRYIRTRTKL